MPVGPSIKQTTLGTV